MNFFMAATGLLLIMFIVSIRVIEKRSYTIKLLREKNKKLKYELEAANASKIPCEEEDIVFDAEGGYHIIKRIKDERPETVSVEGHS